MFENSFSDKTGVMNENIIDKILFDFMQWVLQNMVLGLGIFMRSISSVVVQIKIYQLTKLLKYA